MGAERVVLITRVERRRWSVAEKLRLAAARAPRMSVAAMARQHGSVGEPPVHVGRMTI
jgi:transposase-like protein